MLLIKHLLFTEVVRKRFPATSSGVIGSAINGKLVDLRKGQKKAQSIGE